MQHHLALNFTLQNNDTLKIGVDLALWEISDLLEEYGKCLLHYGLPEPHMQSWEVEHEMNCWRRDQEMLKSHTDEAGQKMNEEQRGIFDEIIHAITNSLLLIMFIDGKAG